jgi:hypothetical protein
MLSDAGEAEMVKSVMVCVRDVEVLPLKLELVDTNAAVSE